MPRRRLRFAFTIAEGHAAGLTLGGWRLWVSGEDTYITGKTVGGVWKTSLHGDVAWRHAMTREHVISGEAPHLPEGTERAVWTFTPPPFVNGTRLAFVVAAARGCLRRDVLDTRELHIRVEDRWDELTMAQVWMTEHDAEHTFASHARLVGGPLLLSSGRAVWVIAETQRTPAAEAHEPPDGVLLKPMSPESDEVSAPGLLAVGLWVK